MSLRLVCDYSKAEAASSLQQNKNKSLNTDLKQSATLFSQGVACLQDGEHEAFYEGRGAHRDVYRIGNVIMKLCTEAKEQQFRSNRLEAEELN